MADSNWIVGPPPGRGRWCVVWRTPSGKTSVEVVELSPAVIYGDSPDAPFLIKTLRGIAYRFADLRDQLTHHMPLTLPEAP